MATHPSILRAWEFHGLRSLAGYSSWGCKESNTTEQRRASEAHKGHEIQSTAERWPPFLVERIVVPGSS